MPSSSVIILDYSSFALQYWEHCPDLHDLVHKSTAGEYEGKDNK